MQGKVITFALMNIGFAYYLFIWHRLIWGRWPERNLEKMNQNAEIPANVQKSYIDLYRSLAWGLFAMVVVLYPISMIMLFFPHVLSFGK